LAAGCFRSAPRAADGGATVVACNDLSSGDAVVEATSAQIADPPVAAGGAMAAGLYHLSASTYYPAPACTVTGVATRLRASPSSATEGTIQIVTATAAGDRLGESVSYTTTGTSLSVRIDCISPDPGGLRGSSAQIPFSATATQIQLYRSTPPCGTSVDTYLLDGT
jgi:uncharacterized phage protein gp47/JayE